jgi:hypothetical protein
MSRVICPSCKGRKAGFAIMCSEQECRPGIRPCDLCHGEGEVSPEAEARWREGEAMRKARIKQGRTVFGEAKRLGVDPFELNQAEFGRKSLQEVLDENRRASDEKRKSYYYGEIYVGCGERKDGRWNVIVIPPAGERDDLRVVQADLEFLEAAEVAARLRKQVREHPHAESLSADELLRLCIGLLNIN